MQQKQMKIGILDDHPLVVNGVEHLISSKTKFQISFSCTKIDGIHELIKEHQINILIIDIVLSDVSGTSLLERIRLAFPELLIVAYSSLSSTILIKNLLSIGINAFVNKMQNESDLIIAIHSVCSNQIYLPQDYQYLLNTKTNEFQKLSEREIEVLQLIIMGKISKEIANDLHISKNTVDIHRASLFKKFDVQNLAELIQIATKMGY